MKEDLRNKTLEFWEALKIGKSNKSPATNVGRDVNKGDSDLVAPTVTIQFMSFLPSGIKSVLTGALSTETNSVFHPTPMVPTISMF